MNEPMIYEVRKPNHIDPIKRYPAIFLMHGMGSNERNMLSLLDGLEEQFYIFSIRGHLNQPPGYAYFTIQGYGKPHRDVFDEAITRLSSFIDYTIEQYNIDTNNLFLLGFSQGAILSETLALTLVNKIKGIVALSGYIPAFVKEEYTIKKVTDLSVFISHGKHDQVLPYEWGVESKEYFEQLGARVTFRSYEEPHAVSLQNQQDLINWIVKLKEE
ncbi:alpha/beta hydrolase [Bacillus suaedaesalsae]|uniref:Esterase n=1 Tax=Bacillus suaedaesalsae TaxID=2810349 RepID=A0ABS2DCV5_9BACI|nr:esterase [Bacillus suaedaesalsae]MBM6616297.1 esterase [Bacillus suaedaesalsae]